VTSIKKVSGVPVRASARRGGVRGARGGGGAAGGGNGRPPSPSSPSKATHTRRKSNTSFTAYHTDMLARVVRNTILGATPWAKRSLNAIKVTLNEYVSKRVTSVRALRVRDFCLKEMYGEWSSGSSHLKLTVLGLKSSHEQGSSHPKLTVLGLKSSHEHRYGGKTEGVAWSDMVADTEAVVAQYFGEVPEGTKYVVGMSFVRPSGLALVNQDLMHRITFHDARHMKDAGHVPYGGVFKQTNAQDTGNRVVSCMTTVTCFNE